MTVLTPTQIAKVASDAGFPATELPTAVAVAYAESGGNPQAKGGPNKNGSYDYGLFQINSVHSQLLSSGDWADPAANARMAYQVWKGSGWKAWSTYNNGRYQTVPAEYRQASWNLGDLGGGVFGSPLNPGGGFSPLSGIDAIGHVFSTLSDGSWWRRVGIVAAGIGLLVIGLLFVFRDQATDAVTTVVGKTLKA